MDIYSSFGTIALQWFSVLDIEHALNQIKCHPTLLRRLITLKKEGVRLTSAFANPWFEEMKFARVNSIDIEIADAFFTYKEQQKGEELKALRKSGRAEPYTSFFVN